ncbi:MAG: hypothetical protein OEQ53_18420 [Saprospiraceae bacterium]|nr:hypothetical protein [Saprospiraceae bacterium]
MTPHLARTVIVLVLALLVIQCGSSTAGERNGGDQQDSASESDEYVPGGGTVQLQLNGTSWKSSPNNSHRELGVEAISDGATTIVIEAFATDGSYITITIGREAGLSPGSTYTVQEQSLQLAYEKNHGQNGTMYLSSGMRDNPGTLTIEKFTQEGARGTFNSQIRSSVDPDDIIEIADGKFDVTFTVY